MSGGRVLSPLLKAFPEAGIVVVGKRLSLEARQKRFGGRLDDHHGDGRLAVITLCN